MEDKTFVVTDEHLKLVPHLYFRFDGHSPVVSAKNPFGDSMVYESMGKILGIPKLPEDNYEFSSEVCDHLGKLFEEMATVLQIGVRVGYFREGTYVASAYGSDWREA